MGARHTPTLGWRRAPGRRETTTVIRHCANQAKVRKSSYIKRAKAAPRSQNVIQDVVADYLNRYGDRAERELRFFEIQTTLRDALRLAGNAEGPGGKRLSHQRRLASSTLRRASERLLDAEAQIRECRDFHALWELVNCLIGDIRGVGELMVYDTANRIAAKLGLAPTRVYLHAGTRRGAAALGVGRGLDSIDLDELPQGLHTLTPRQIEDVLCIYKHELTSGAKPSRVTNRMC